VKFNFVEKGGSTGKKGVQRSSTCEKNEPLITFLLLFHINLTLPVKFLLWADPDFFEGYPGQLPSLKDSPDN